MSNQSRVQRGVPSGGQFAVSAKAEPGVSLEALGADDRAEWDTSADVAALDADIAVYRAAKARIEMQSARIVSRKILNEWPDAAHLEMDVSDQGDESMWPVAVLDADGKELADADDIDDADYDISSILSNLHDDDGDWTAFRSHLGERGSRPALDLKSAAAIPDSDVAGPQQPAEPTWEQQLAEHQATVGEQIRERFYPDAVEWSVGATEYDNGFFYDESQVEVTLADGSVRELDMSGTYSADALTEISGLDQPGRSSVHRAKIAATAMSQPAAPAQHVQAPARDRTAVREAVEGAISAAFSGMSDRDAERFEQVALDAGLIGRCGSCGLNLGLSEKGQRCPECDGDVEWKGADL